ncbi:M20 metallopeptidase family protein [Brevibacillus marinus]|uniref:M20 metallopeptidase family protein n=1 Tax=Brevibacillus marinus TaxID=2496837 RepID=UPI000F81F829|nr:amidohydrolase [Brevibacillus marinus]
MYAALFARLEQIYPELVAIRRDLHQYPELSFQEVNTPRKIAELLTAYGLEVRSGVGGRGVVGLLRGGKPGKTVALRADFDALPIQDEKDVAYKSRVPGVMHACGHDIHTAWLLGVAKVLSEFRDELTGNVVFIHQFAEELTPGGAKPMIADGCLDGVDVIYGAHVSSLEPYGTIGIAEGYASANADRFEIEIFGKGGHGAQPHLTVDPVVTGSQLVLNLQQIVSRRVNPLHPTVLTIGSFVSGSAFNIIPDTAKIVGTVRTFDAQTRRIVEQSIHAIAKATCEAAGAEVSVRYEHGYDAMWNDPLETKRVERLAEQIVGKENVKRLEPNLGGEDFAYYLQQVPGSFFFVGGRNPELDAVYPHHHPRFDVDERSLIVGGKLLLSATLDYLSDTTTAE